VSHACEHGNELPSSAKATECLKQLVNCHTEACMLEVTTQFVRAFTPKYPNQLPVHTANR
jgi:hypothetical protein